MNLDSFLRVIFFYTQNKPNYSSIQFEGEKIGVRGQERVFFFIRQLLFISQNFSELQLF